MPALFQLLLNFTKCYWRHCSNPVRAWVCVSGWLCCLPVCPACHCHCSCLQWQVSSHLFLINIWPVEV